VTEKEKATAMTTDKAAGQLSGYAARQLQRLTTTDTEKTRKKADPETSSG
jgi:hypothetical protein